MRKTSLWPKSDPFYRELLEEHNDLTRMMVELYKVLKKEVDDRDEVVKKVPGLGKWLGQQSISRKEFKKAMKG